MGIQCCASPSSRSRARPLEKVGGRKSATISPVQNMALCAPQRGNGCPQKTTLKEHADEKLPLSLSREIEPGAASPARSDGAHEQDASQALPGRASPADERSVSRSTKGNRWTDCRGALHQSPHRDSYQTTVCPGESAGGSDRKLPTRTPRTSLPGWQGRGAPDSPGV
jgi:hypothetical protein